MANASQWLSPWKSVYGYFREWKKSGLWQRIHEKLRKEVREQAGRHKEPRAGIISVGKNDRKRGPKGYDAGKTIKGRKRHILVDTLGLIRSLSVQPADRPDRDGAKWVLQKVAVTATRLTLIWADDGYAGKLIAWVKDICGWRLEIVKRSDDVKGFKVVPKRWIVERTFAWLYGYRRLSKDYEYLVSSSENMIYIAMIQLMLRRLAMNST